MWKLVLWLFQVAAASDFLVSHATLPVAPVDYSEYDQALSAEAEGCEALNLTALKIRGHDFSQIANLLCETWPASFGRFPVQSSVQVEELLTKLFDTDGVWDTLKSAFNKKNETYCLRKQVQRVKLIKDKPDEKACPVTVDEDLLEEIGEDDTDPKLKDGFWACQNDTADDDQCACNRRDQGGIGSDTVMVQRRPKGCKMVHRGECFGKCPVGYRPTFFVGWFRPVCTNICWETDHPYSCGVGCAVTRGACVQIILRQILSVITSVARVVSFFVKGAKYVDIAAQVVRIAEFALQVVRKAVNVAVKVYDAVTSREQAGFAMVTAVFQLLREEARGLPQLWTEFRNLISGTRQFFLQLVDAQYGWKNVNLNWIAGVLTRDPSNSTLAAAYQMTKEFAYGKCEVSLKTEVFTIEESGDDRIVGPWFRKGKVAGKPKYVLTTDDKKTRIESTRRNVWKVWYKDTSFGRGWWFGWLGLGWRELYYNNVNVNVVPTLGWVKKEGKLPVPQIAIVEDGGESDQ